MSDQYGLHDDDELRKLYRSVGSEPDAAIDARILNAARTAAETPASGSRHTWRYRVGLGAAASALLALTLLVPTLINEQRPGNSYDAPAVLPAAPQEQASARKEAPGPSTTFAHDHAIARMPSVATAPPAAAVPSQQTPPQNAHAENADRMLNRLYAPSAAVGAVAGRAAVRAACPDGAQSQSTAGLLLCISANRIELRDLSPAGCVEPVYLERTTGSVGIARIDADVSITIDGAPHWRAHCAAGAWQVRLVDNANGQAAP
jgi:hypothetical protein